MMDFDGSERLEVNGALAVVHAWEYLYYLSEEIGVYLLSG